MCADDCPPRHIACSVDECQYFESGADFKIVKKGDVITTLGGEMCWCGKRYHYLTLT